MTLSDKIVQLRKQKGWSQEELAERIGVSRQAVSKWESAQAAPDIDKILLLSELFDVSTDYLLKDGEDVAAKAPAAPEDMETQAHTCRTVTKAEAEQYLQGRRRQGLYMALATLLCILSPICLILLSSLSEFTYGPPAIVGVALGLIALFLMIAGAVAIFVYCHLKNEPFAFLDREEFALEAQAKLIIEAARSAYRARFITFNILGTALCILSPLPLIVGGLCEQELLTLLLLNVTLLLAGVGVFFFVCAGTYWGAFARLLCEGEFTARKKRESKLMDTVGSIFWLTVTAVYLGWSFATSDWGHTWILWPVAAVVFAIISTICGLFLPHEEKSE